MWGTMERIEFIHLRPYSDDEYKEAVKALVDMVSGFAAHSGPEMRILESKNLGNDLALAIIWNGERENKLSELIRMALIPFGDVCIRDWGLLTV